MYIFRSLKHRNFRIHFTGQAISLVGTWMQRIGISWLIYSMTGSALMLGVVSFVGLIPSLLLSPFIGSFIDQHNKYRTLIVAQSGLMLQSGLLAALVWSGLHTIPLILVLSLMQGVFNAVEVNARQSFMLILVENKQDLPNAIALNSTAFNAARIVGPALGGIVLGLYGEAWCFMINFVSFVAVLGTLMMIRVQETAPSGPRESTWDGFKQGYRYLQDHPHLRALVLLLASSSLLVIPYTTLLPVIARTLFQGGAQTYSWFESAAGIGAMIGAVYMARLQAGSNLRFRVMFGSGLMGLGLLILPFASHIILALCSVTFVALGMMVQNSCVNTYLQTHTVPQFRGRIISYYIMAFQGIFPLGSLLIGWLAQNLGVQYTLLMQGTAGILISLGYMYYIFRRIQNHRLAL